MESKILIAVAWADLILCEIGRVLPFLLGAAAAGMLAAAVSEAWRRRR